MISLPGLARTLAVALLLCPVLAGAQPYDPAYRWRTIETPHFRVHFHQGEERLADEVAGAAERAHAVLSPALGYSPRTRSEVVLSDDTDEANGSATPFPYDTIRLFATPPSELSDLNAYRNWLSNLVFHEYTHILHMDHVEGVPAVFDRIFGKLLVPNGMLPGWFTEGLAVLHEADGDPGLESGRNRSALHDMYVRSLALEKPGFPRLSQASNPPLWWPAGNVAYVLGGRFLEFLQERNGPDAIRKFVARQGAQIWPYAPSHVGDDYFGATFPELWDEYAKHEEERSRAEIERIRQRPVTHPTRITFQGGLAGWPCWSGDGSSIAYLRSDLDEMPALLQVTPTGGKAGPSIQAIAGAGLAAGGGRAVLSRSEVWHEYRLYRDLWEVNLRAGSSRRLTHGARDSDPALSADGVWLAYVRRTGPGEMALEKRRLAGGPEEKVFAEPGVQVFAPALSPDGRLLAFSLQQAGRRDIALFDGDRLVRVTDDAAIDASAAFTPDGKWLLFSSDRGGVYNLYAWPVEPCLAGGDGCALRQVTNVESGAFQPAVSPDGRTIALVTYSRDGYDLATLPFDPSSWLDPEPAPAAEPEPARQPAPQLASRPYRSLGTLAPGLWLPLVGVDPKGATIGAFTMGGDVLGRHSYAGEAWWGLKSREPGYALSYLGGWSWPRLDLSSSLLVASARAGRKLQTVWTPADVGLDFTFTRLDWAALVRLGWDGTFRKVLGGPSGTARQPEDLGVVGGFGSEVTARAVWSDAHQFVRSISPEEGRTVSLFGSQASKKLGGDYDLALARGSVAQYLRVPFTRHAVLALRLAGGAADGSIGHTAPFELGGPVQGDPLSFLLAVPPAGGDELRGYPVGWLEGTGFALANAEARFPVFSPELGHSTWPIFLRRVHGAVFADLGDAFDLRGNRPFAGHEFRWDELRLGAGAEVRLEVALGYSILTDVRLGVAHPFGRVFRGESQERDADPVQGYVVLGGGF